MASASLQRRFEQLLEETRAQMPDDESAAQIVLAYRKHWDAPPLAQLELLLQRTTSLADARLLLFFPEPVDMPRYVGLVAGGPRGSPDHHPQNQLQRPFLALLYMRHVRSWPLMREFILDGGLLALLALFEAENLYLRAQAVDTFMQLTSTELHDWFAEPVLEPRVHRRFADLAAPSAHFVRAIEANFGGSFPGASYYALQILAFWLSLLRYFYCEGRVLRLGAKLMGLIERWAASDGLPQEERELARKLVDDFGRFPTVENLSDEFIGAAGPADSLVPAPPLGAEGAVAGEERIAVEVGSEATVPSAPSGSTSHEATAPAAAASPPAAEEPAESASAPRDGPPAQPIVLTDKKGADELKEEGNAALKKGDVKEAIRCYSAGLDLCLPSSRYLFLSNRSAAYLKLASAGAQPNAELTPPSREWAELAKADASEAVRLRPDFVKARFRVGQSLSLLSLHAEAVEAYEAALHVAPYNDELRAALRAAREAVERERRAALRAAKEEAPPAAAAERQRKGVAVDYQQAAATAARAAELAEKKKQQAKLEAAAEAEAGVPSSFQQFEREWAELRGAPAEKQQAWLARLPAAGYAALFKESLTEGTLTSLVGCVHAALLPAGEERAPHAAAAGFALQVLEGLASTRRFGMLLMFLDAPPRAAVRQIFQALRASGHPASPSLLKAWECT
ncbi:hypothetical protein AB1Y20_012073 [Prymnesium parvum]|uniref:RNA-polymerase II-associated protein 3-like C-terminal domain-containing protein n=1 Tax=Prymnesium parvum TaxID=97485 RepID=A0AB34IMF2_PRYPA